MSLPTIIEAIDKRKTLRYKYIKLGEATGERIGHPYVVFMFTTKTGITSTKVHIVQLDGDSKSVIEKPFPSFRMYNIEELQDVEIIEEIAPFGEPFHDDYNPEWEKYIDVIAKI